MGKAENTLWIVVIDAELGTSVAQGSWLEKYVAGETGKDVEISVSRSLDEAEAILNPLKGTSNAPDLIILEPLIGQTLNPGSLRNLTLGEAGLAFVRRLRDEKVWGEGAAKAPLLINTAAFFNPGRGKKTIQSLQKLPGITWVEKPSPVEEFLKGVYIALTNTDGFIGINVTKDKAKKKK